MKEENRELTQEETISALYSYLVELDYDEIDRLVIITLVSGVIINIILLSYTNEAKEWKIK